MKKFLAFFLTAMLLVCSLATATADYSIDTTKSSVVQVLVDFTIDDPASMYAGTNWTSLGSGFFVGDYESSTAEYVVTSGHVICRAPMSGANQREGDTYFELQEPADSGNFVYRHVQINFIHVLIGDRDSFVNAKFVGASDRADVAVLQLNNPISSSIRKIAVMRDTESFETTAAVRAMGFPTASAVNLSENAMGELISDTDSVTVNLGAVSRVMKHSQTQWGDQIMTTAEMSPGISGGPLVDENGYVVGVCASGAVTTDNVNYAIATSEVLRLIRGVLPNLKVTTGPLKEGLSSTMIIIIAAAALVIILLIVLIIVSSNGKKNRRTLVLNAAMGGKTIELKKNTPVVIGRDPNRCQIVYPKDAPGVSSVHCTITYNGNEVVVADNGSSYGTYVGGQKVEPGKPVVMHRGQEIYFGSDKNTAELH